MDGGEGCSEYIIHGTNVDISDPPTEGEEREQIEGGEASKKEEKSGEDVASQDVDSSNTGQAKL